MERRSAKRTTPRKRYTTDAFEGIEELQDVRSDDETAMVQVEDDGSAEEYEDDAHGSPDEFEDLEVEGELDEDASDDASDAGQRLLSETMSISEDPDGIKDVRPATALMDLTSVDFKSRAKKTRSEAVKTYTRGTLEAIGKLQSKDSRRLYYFGPSASDYKPVHAARVKWAYEPTLPSRSADKHGFGGMHRSFFLDDDAWTKEVNFIKASWIDQGGKKAFNEKQILESVAEDRTLDYMPEREADAISFLMGPFKSQQLFRLPVGGSISLKEVWEPESQDNQAPQSALRTSYKSGFMLNLGARVQCLDWAPSQIDQQQYLAASVLPKRQSDYAPFEAPEAPAFTPQPATKSNVQIWKFTAREEGTIDTEVEPQLQLVLCTDWGDPKSLKWCPVSCDLLDQSKGVNLGLLAGIWSDGAVRVLNITLPPKSTTKSFLHVKQATFESRPPGTVCTCMTWVTGTRIAVGCANGCIAVWDLTASIKSSSSNTRPKIYSSVSTSYVLSIISCYPSRPNMLLTASMSGFIAMIDLTRSGQTLCSHASTVFSNRSRIGQPLLIWHDFAQVAIHVDDNFTLRGSSIRRLFTTVGLGRYKSSATSLVGSRCHPFVLAGTAHGEVVASNPVRRVVDGKAGIWQQTWFAHEWRRTTTQETTTADAAATSDGHVQEAANDSEKHRPNISVASLSRISEGFKVERVTLTNDDRNAYNQRDGTLFATVYEEKSAITALAWNPNPRVGGWAAAGMSSGLLRVEDIAALDE